MRAEYDGSKIIRGLPPRADLWYYNSTGEGNGKCPSIQLFGISMTTRMGFELKMEFEDHF
jgi:hypothetical protein